MKKITGVVVHDLDDEMDSPKDRFYPAGTTKFNDDLDESIVNTAWEMNDHIKMGMTLAWIETREVA